LLRHREYPAFQNTYHPAQLQVIAEMKRFNVLDCGRRWGKTVLGMGIVSELALHGYPVGWFAPSYQFLGDAWRNLAEKLLPYTTRSNATEHRIELVSGGVVEMWSLDSGNAGRSRKYARVVVDEAAMVPALIQAWNSAIRPTLADLRGDAWFLSTPRGRNDFWQLYQYGLDPLRAEWMCWKMPTSSNPFIPPEEIEAARKDSPERSFQEEYLAEFLEDSAVFRKIREAATAKQQEYAQHHYPSHPKHSYIIGVDWGKYEDFSVFAVVDATTKELCHLDRSNMIDYTMQIRRLEDLSKRFGNASIVAEGNAQDTTIELIRKTGLSVREFTTNNINKQHIIEGLMLGLEQGKLKILDDAVLIGELQAFEATRLPGGGLRYAAPQGMHDDCVMALALAWDAVGNYAPVRVEKRR
jgi:hypothetical protein